MNKQQQEYFMGLALQESKKALPRCQPNPPVGCVLVQGQTQISCGYTREPGRQHAEADALSRVDGDLGHVSAFVTLEPCSFTGRTPSCAETLIERHIGCVFVALIDPDHRNNGAGIELLRKVGIEVYTGILENEVRKFLSPYLHESPR